MSTRRRIAARFNVVLARRFFRWALAAQSMSEKFFSKIKGGH